MLAVLMPWDARNTAEFGRRGMFAIIVAVVLSAVTRYGLELIAVRSAGPSVM
jgi:hypothetical protein